jgi:glycosyltransferase involved in cell wall biosynthesis
MEMDAELVTVIIPTYNRAHLVTGALDSVYEQTYRPIECIVVDDGSTDDTVQVVEDWKRAHNSDDFCVRLFQQENQGAPVARNHGMEQAKGELLLFLDSDDALTDGAIEALRQSMDESDSDAVYGDVVRVSEDGQKKRESQRPTSASNVVNMLRAAPLTGSIIIRRKAVEDVKWRAELSCAQEFAFFLDLSLHGLRFTYEPTVVLEIKEFLSQNRISRRDDTDYPLTISRILVDVGPQVRALGEQENMQYDRGLVHFAGILYRKGHRDEADDLFRRAHRVRALKSALQNWRTSVFLPALLTPRWSDYVYTAFGK